MYLGTLPQVSNRATWIADIEIVNDDTGSAYDISGALEITAAIRDQNTKAEMLSATLSGGTISLVDTSTLRWTFTRDQMATLCVGTYDFGLTIKFASETDQIIIGTLPVLDGVVSR